MPEVQVVDEKGDNRGVMPTSEARLLAEAAGLDLVEVVPNKAPPVCKIIDFGRYKYEKKKKANQAKKNAKAFAVKEIKIRPNININDYRCKIRSAKKFLEDGDKVKITIKFRGREITRKEVLEDLVQKISQDLLQSGKVEQKPSLEGNSMNMVFSSA